MSFIKELSATFAFIFCFALVALDSSAGIIEVYDEDPVVQYVKKFTKNVNKSKQKKALSLVPYVIEAAEKYAIDPLWVAVNLACESSFGIFGQRKGKLGEIGLGQVHGTALRIIKKAGINLKTERGQIEGIAFLLKEGINRCGNYKNSQNWYQTGRCKNFPQPVKRRLRLYKKARKEFLR